MHYETDVYTFTEEEGEDREDAIRISVRGREGDFFLNAYLDEEEIFGSVEAASIYIRLGSMITLFLFPVLYLVIRSLLIVPLKALNGALKSVELGDLDYRIRERANSLEYQQSFTAFNVMAEKIKTLKIQNYEKELEREKMELKNLQLQIRPHFLLNTFNLLFALAKRHEDGAIQEIILYLSDYFRYLFRSGKSLELFWREQGLIEGYIRMVKIRYPGCIEIHYLYAPEIKFVRLPPLLLHNFVENVVKHVVKKGRLTKICIVGQYENKKVTFLVMDNGQGIAEDKVREVDAAMRQESFSGAYVGFVNSLKRMKYFYGSGADIAISSVEGEGTCIILTIPYNLEEENDTVDCE